MKAHASQVRISTRKVRLVADSIRNMSAADALASLAITKKHGSYALVKALKSAMANAVNNSKMNVDNLVIASLQVNEGPFLKRFHASTRGRIHGYKKRSSHITIVLKESKNKIIPKVAVSTDKEEKGEKSA